jgi:molybdopterin-containing oxidoreductase family iron-sulfur binding subunit
MTRLQAACGMQGRTVDLARAQDYSRVGSLVDIDRLMQRLDGGSVGTLIVFNTDPVSQLPNAEKFAQSLDHAGFVIGVADILTPTMERADVVLPLSHALESWGDAEPATGVLNVIQPTFDPLFDTASDGDVLLRHDRDGCRGARTTYQRYDGSLGGARPRRSRHAAKQGMDCTRRGRGECGGQR